MTDEQKRAIERNFYNYNPNNTFDPWVTVFDYMLIRYKFKAEEKFLYKKYIEHKSRKQVCKEVGISLSTYRYWKEKLLLDAYMFARAEGLL